MQVKFVRLLRHPRKIIPHATQLGKASGVGGYCEWFGKCRMSSMQHDTNIQMQTNRQMVTRLCILQTMYSPWRVRAFEKEKTPEEGTVQLVLQVKIKEL